MPIKEKLFLCWREANRLSGDYGDDLENAVDTEESPHDTRDEQDDSRADVAVADCGHKATSFVEVRKKKTRERQGNFLRAASLLNANGHEDTKEDVEGKVEEEDEIADRAVFPAANSPSQHGKVLVEGRTGQRSRRGDTKR